MRIDRFASTQYRNLAHEPISPSPHVNVFVGPNGHGKTNILEALQFFQFGRSFRTQRDHELIRFDAEFCRFDVSAQSVSGDRETFAASIQRNGGKRIKVGVKDVARYSEMIGRYPCVLFGPHDLAVVSGPPAERRRFLDAIGCMTDRTYLRELRGYRQVVRQRNAAFKARRTGEALGVWTEELIQRGCAVTEKRLAVLDAIRTALQPHCKAMAVPFSIGVHYESELTDRPDGVSFEEQYAARLAAAETEETRRGITMVGPHRDDVRIVVDGRDLRAYGSQGQRRLVAILLRLAELSHLEGALREPCVLMLDDLFSELDADISGSLKRALMGERQVFVTSPVPLAWAEPACVFEVLAGHIKIP